MKKLMVAWTILGGLFISGPASADVKVEKILVNQVAKTAEGTNIRVDLVNTDSRFQALGQVELQAREDSNAPWKTVKTWTRPMAIWGRQRLALDFLPMAEGGLDPTLAAYQYELRAIVTPRDGSQVISQTKYVSEMSAGR